MISHRLQNKTQTPHRGPPCPPWPVTANLWVSRLTALLRAHSTRNGLFLFLTQSCSLWDNPKAFTGLSFFSSRSSQPRWKMPLPQRGHPLCFPNSPPSPSHGRRNLFSFVCYTSFPLSALCAATRVSYLARCGHCRPGTPSAGGQWTRWLYLCKKTWVRTHSSGGRVGWKDLEGF